MAGQIGRYLALGCVDEVIVYDDEQSSHRRPTDVSKSGNTSLHPVLDGSQGTTDSAIFLARNLQYMETPPYLRKAFFPVHKHLKNVGLLNPLDTPHHVRVDERSMYREGVVVNRPGPKLKTGGVGCWVNVGLKHEVEVARPIRPGVRVTVKMMDGRATEAVTPTEPKEKERLYWGYTTRLATT